MRQFLTTSFLFCGPLILWAIWVVVIDPYNYFQTTIIPDSAKEKTSFRMNVFTSTIIGYNNDPSGHLLIGDSRTNGLSLDYIKEVSGTEYKTLAIPAAKLNEIIELAYFSHKIQPLKHLVVGLNLTLMNRFAYADRVSKMERMLGNPFLYIFNRPIAKASFRIVRYLISGSEVIVKPDMTKEEAWEYITKDLTRHWYERFAYSDELEIKLNEFSSFAQKNNIQWTIIIVPHHAGFRNKLSEHNRDGDLKRFHGFLRDLNATVIDYDFDNSITMKKDNFDDPVHYNKEIGNMIIEEVWNKNYQVGRLLSQE